MSVSRKHIIAHRMYAYLSDLTNAYAPDDDEMRTRCADARRAYDDASYDLCIAHLCVIYSNQPDIEDIDARESIFDLTLHALDNVRTMMMYRATRRTRYASRSARRVAHSIAYGIEMYLRDDVFMQSDIAESVYDIARASRNIRTSFVPSLYVNERGTFVDGYGESLT